MRRSPPLMLVDAGATGRSPWSAARRAAPSIASSRSMTAARWASTSSMSRSRRRTATIEDYLYVDDAKGLLACVQMGTIEFHGWGSRVEAARKARPAGVRPRSRRRARLRRGQGRRPSGCATLLADLGLETFPMLTGGKGIHVVAPLDAERRLAEGQELRRALQPRHRRGRARALHRQHPQEPAQGPDLPRLAAQPARRDRGHALFGARPRRRAGGGADRLGGAGRVDGANAFTIRDADELLERAGSKLLAGWGEAKQTLPDL